jgi:hypothetical protein
MSGLLRVFHDMLEYFFRMSFFIRGNNGRGVNRGANRDKGNWQRGHRRARFQYILMLIHMN